MVGNPVSCLFKGGEIFIRKRIPEFRADVVRKYPAASALRDQFIDFFQRFLYGVLREKLGFAHDHLSRGKKLGKHQIFGLVGETIVETGVHDGENITDFTAAFHRFCEHYVKELVHIIYPRRFHQNPVVSSGGSVQQHILKGYFSGTAHTSAGDLADVAALIPQNDGIHADASEFIFDDIDFLFLPLQIVRISADEGCLAGT